MFSPFELPLRTSRFLGNLRGATIEAGVLVLLTGIPIIRLPISLTARIMILCLITLPLGIFGVIGIEGDALSEFLICWVKWLILEAMQDSSDDIPRMVISSTAKALSNILEDGYVDARYSYEFPGNPARGIALNNLRINEKAPDIESMVNRKYCDHNIVLNLLIQYVNAGEVNNLSGYTGELLDAVNALVPVIDACVLDEDARARCDAANRILIDLWPMMQRCFDSLRDMKQQAQNQSNQSQSGSCSSGVPGSGSPVQNPNAGSKAVEEELESQLPKSAPNFTVKTSHVRPTDYETRGKRRRPQKCS